ncbi:MAG: DUF362 domain-containing protein [candidate division Zixibacteria bacterium]|nr:DUF362 domain-containing protein [candidate division Zixibacteria bacterium]
MSKVVVVRRSGAESGDEFTNDHYRALLDVALPILSGMDDVSAAVKKYFPGGRVGMKVNCLTRRYTCTPVALTEAFLDVLENAGFDANDLVVWERTSGELQRAGYTLNASSFGRRCLGTDSRSVGYGRVFHSYGDVSSLISRVLLEMVDHNVNLPVLKDHSLAGLSGGLKNMFGAINNPNKYHDNNCNPFVAHVANLQPIRDKHRLTIMDAVRVQYDQGPGYSSDYIADYHGLIISNDPVAADRVGLEVLEHFRRARGLPTLAQAGRPARYLASAQEIGLGVADMDRIDLSVRIVDEGGQVRPGRLF